jgi:hypothetical protein
MSLGFLPMFSKAVFKSVQHVSGLFALQRDHGHILAEGVDHYQPDLVVLVLQVIHEEQIYLILLIGFLSYEAVVASEVALPHLILGEPVADILQLDALVDGSSSGEGVLDGTVEIIIDIGDGITFLCISSAITIINMLLDIIIDRINDWIFQCCTAVCDRLTELVESLPDD